MSETMLIEIFGLRNLLTVVDIVIVAVVLYWVMLMFKGTRAERMFWGLAVVILVHFISQSAELLTLHWIISNFLGSIIIFIIVVFQQDIRRALVHMGRPFSSRGVTSPVVLLDEVTGAVAAMSKSRTGALIVMERSIDNTDFLDAGVDMDSQVSSELLQSIFNPASPLHDGGVLIREDRLARAGCILPLTDRELSSTMGTRHRAAVGLAEETDAAIIVVSEQTGDITFVVDGELTSRITVEELRGRIEALFGADEGRRWTLVPWRVRA